MSKIYKIFILGGLIYLCVGIILELLYWIIFVNLYWILTIYPPPEMKLLIDFIPYMGGIFILVGSGCLLAGISLFLKADIDNLRKFS
ncbi:MAG TPA: hypothetical protein VMV49_14660 [Candidatus Deferrimicrobium sp.]|nr:hypothetical protein [Candidatus Deferrimicrobium sp.]